MGVTRFILVSVTGCSVTMALPERLYSLASIIENDNVRLFCLSLAVLLS